MPLRLDDEPVKDEISEIPELSGDELRKLRQDYPNGLRVNEILAILRDRGCSISNASIQKYVQLKLLPTSSRMGQTGSHKGSYGVYPIDVVTRVIDIQNILRSSNVTLPDLAGMPSSSGVALLITLESQLTRLLISLLGEGQANDSLDPALSESRDLSAKSVHELLSLCTEVRAQLAQTNQIACRVANDKEAS